MFKPLYECSRSLVDRNVTLHGMLVPVGMHHVGEDVSDGLVQSLYLVRCAVRKLDGVQVLLGGLDVLRGGNQVIASFGSKLISNLGVPVSEDK